MLADRDGTQLAVDVDDSLAQLRSGVRRRPAAPREGSAAARPEPQAQPPGWCWRAAGLAAGPVPRRRHPESPTRRSCAGADGAARPATGASGCRTPGTRTTRSSARVPGGRRAAGHLRRRRRDAVNAVGRRRSSRTSTTRTGSSCSATAGRSGRRGRRDAAAAYDPFANAARAAAEESATPWPRGCSGCSTTGAVIDAAENGYWGDALYRRGRSSTTYSRAVWRARPRTTGSTARWRSRRGRIADITHWRCQNSWCHRKPDLRRSREILADAPAGSRPGRWPARCGVADRALATRTFKDRFVC